MTKRFGQKDLDIKELDKNNGNQSNVPKTSNVDNSLKKLHLKKIEYISSPQ